MRLYIADQPATGDIAEPECAGAAANDIPPALSRRSSTGTTCSGTSRGL